MDNPKGRRGNERIYHKVATPCSVGKKNAKTIILNRIAPPSQVRYSRGISWRRTYQIRRATITHRRSWVMTRNIAGRP
jgi:hypothetical protein